MSETPLTERLRRMLLERMSECPCCGNERGNVRELAEAMGVDRSQLYGWLAGRRDVGALFIDRVAAYVEREGDLTLTWSHGAKDSTE